MTLKQLIFLAGLILFIPTLHLLRQRELRSQETRAQQSCDYLHRHVEPQISDDFAATLVWHDQDAICIVYRDTDDKAQWYLDGHAVLPDHSQEITWDLDATDSLWVENCGASHPRDLLEYVRPEDRDPR